MEQIIIINMEDEINQANSYAQKYAKRNERHIRAEYGNVILAIQENKGIIGFDEDLEKLVKATSTIDKIGAVVYGRVDDFLQDRRLFGRVLK